MRQSAEQILKEREEVGTQVRGKRKGVGYLLTARGKKGDERGGVGGEEY